MPSPRPGRRATARCWCWCPAPPRSVTAAPATSCATRRPGLTRRGGAPSADFVYAGAGILDTAALDGFPAAVFSLNAVWDRLRDANRLRGIVHPGGWVDVGRPEGIALAEAELAR